MKKALKKEWKYFELDGIYRRKQFFGIDFYEFVERAAIRMDGQAIMEFDGKMKAEIAAGLAFNDIIKNYTYSKGTIK